MFEWMDKAPAATNIFQPARARPCKSLLLLSLFLSLFLFPFFRLLFRFRFRRRRHPLIRSSAFAHFAGFKAAR